MSRPHSNKLADCYYSHLHFTELENDNHLYQKGNSLLDKGERDLVNTEFVKVNSRLHVNLIRPVGERVRIRKVTP